MSTDNIYVVSLDVPNTTEGPSEFFKKQKENFKNKFWKKKTPIDKSEKQKENSENKFWKKTDPLDKPVWSQRQYLQQIDKYLKTEIALEDKVRTQKREKDELRQKNEKFQTEIDQLKQNIRDYADENKDLVRQNVSLKDEKNAVKKKLDLSRQVAIDQEGKLAQKTQEIFQFFMFVLKL